ncbi:uncharacterized protein [Haliotis asinina]|uniref:uncharacterized protein n=1 Tax=Haliotis asinina TaxID=109174 RepID=UPI003532626B
MAHLSHEDKMQYTQIFLKLDDEVGDKTGALDIKAFEKFLIMSGYRLPKERVAEVFCRADHDGNWKITLEEFLARLPQIAPAGSPEARASVIRRRFEKSDMDHDGYLTFEELTVLMGGIQDDEEALRELVQCMIDKWDGDGDGKINFEEFLTMYLEADLEEEDFADLDAAETEKGEVGEVNKGEEDHGGKEEDTKLKPTEQEAVEEELEKTDIVSTGTEEEQGKPDNVSTGKEEEQQKLNEVSAKTDVQEKQEDRTGCGVESKAGDRIVGGGVNVKSMAARLEKMAV